MIKASLVVMVVLTVVIATGLRWREERMGAAARAGAAGRRRPGLVEGWIAAQKRALNRWVTAAAIAVLVTLATLGGLNWLRIWQGG
ncbi:hypothetical protein [Caldovatus aquaticus]|uniref:Uncharacterized protein n=1 Tax=Caldovatus aquaticus TaxID=2865671 RepID=A0ABS7EZP4_9PROT|nr:hypothetical protein [Caldovatus aquaticus]MBW8268718.1 hypothetical protein [Caldovatus aquaticus]